MGAILIISRPLTMGKMKVIEIAQMVSEQNRVFLKMLEEMLFVNREDQSD